MHRKHFLRILPLFALLALLAACAVQAPAAEPPSAEEASAPADGKVTGKNYWVQSSA